MHSETSSFCGRAGVGKWCSPFMSVATSQCLCALIFLSASPLPSFHPLSTSTPSTPLFSAHSQFVSVRPPTFLDLLSRLLRDWRLTADLMSSRSPRYRSIDSRVHRPTNQLTGRLTWPARGHGEVQKGDALPHRWRRFRRRRRLRARCRPSLRCSVRPSDSRPVMCAICCQCMCGPFVRAVRHTCVTAAVTSCIVEVFERCFTGFLVAEISLQPLSCMCRFL